MSTLVEFLVIGVAIGAVYGLLAVPLTLVWNTTGTLDLAVGGYAILGGIAGATIGGVAGWVAGLAFGLVAGCLMGAVYVLLQTRGVVDPLAPVLASLGLLFALISLTLWQFGASPMFSALLSGSLEVAGLRVSPMGLLTVGSVVALTVALVTVLRRTRIGRWMRACAVSPKDAVLVGAPVRAVQFSAFALCGLLGAFGGLLLVSTRGLAFDLGLPLALSGLGALILFGMRGPVTAVLGGLVLGLVEALASGYLPGGYGPVAPLVFILLVLTSGRFDVHHGTVRP